MSQPLASRHAIMTMNLSCSDIADMADIDFTHLLMTRMARTTNFGHENVELANLASILAENPEAMAQELVNATLRLTDADSAGLSLEETLNDQPIFRWVATAGEFSRYVNGTMPRNFSPCGDVLDRNDAILMRHPVRRYHYIENLHKSCEEVLLVPFNHYGIAVGTVWIVSHSTEKIFDKEDLRIVRSITKFAAAAIQTLGLVKSLRDTNKQNETLMASLQADDERKDNFLAMLAHEMRTPLSAISTGVDLLTLTQSSPQVDNSRILQSIKRQTEQLVALINDLTDISSIKTGKLSLHMEKVYAQDLVSRAVEACNAQIQLRQQHLHVDVPATPIALNGDAIRLTQVLINLLNNANKYTPPEGSINLRVYVDADNVVFSIADTGVGISSVLLPRIFDMFMQDKVSNRPAYSGLGIGLSLVQQFVRLHKGTVTAYSEGTDMGSEFKVTLPHINNEAI